MMAYIMELCLSLVCVNIYAEINQLKCDLPLFLEQGVKGLPLFLC